MEAGDSISAAPETGGGSAPLETASGIADKLALISGAIVAAAVLVGIIVCLAAVKRGLDLTDESDYIFSAQHAGSFLRSSTEFQLVLGPVLSLVRHDWLLRAVKIAALVAAHAFFAWAFLKTAPTLFGARFERFDGIVVSAAIISGALGVSRVLGQTPGYNDLTIFFEVTVMALLLLLADGRMTKRIEPAAWFAAGLLIWFQLLVRWPSTIAIVPLAAITLLWSGRRLPELLKSAGAVAAGAALGAVVTQVFLAPVPDILKGIRQGNTDASAALGHNRGKLLSQYRTNLSDLASVMVHHFWYLLAAAIVAGLLLGFRRYGRIVAIVAGLGVVALTPLFIASGRAHGGVAPFGDSARLPLLLDRSLIVPLYVVLALLAGIASFVIRPESRPSVRSAAIVLSLLAAPFLTALGTNNPIWFNASLLPVFWVSSALAVVSLVHRDHGRLLVHALAFAFATVIAFTAFDGTWRHPYQQLPLAQDTTSIGLSGVLGGLHVDASTAQFLDQIRATADTVRDTTPQPYMVFWSTGLPGASVAAELRQPLFAWLAEPYIAQISLAAACNDRTRGILLLELTTSTVDINSDPTLAVACAGRSWAQRTSVGDVEVFFAPPPS